MNNIVLLLHSIFFGDYGLLTLTPKYLFLVLLPIMVFLELLSQLLPKIPFLQKSNPLVNQIFYQFIGLGCTTAAIVSLEYVKDSAMRSRVIWLLVLIMPCSSQLAIIATFASMVSMRVFFVYLLFYGFFVVSAYWIIAKVYPLNDALVKISTNTSSLRLDICLKRALKSVLATARPFCVGSVLISLAVYFGMLDWFGQIFNPFMEKFLHLPKDATSLFILNILKRDFGSASLLTLAGKGTFDAIQMVVILLMMTFSVPCFNSTILLVKLERLPRTMFIWSGSLLVSILIGKIVSVVLLVCFV